MKSKTKEIMSIEDNSISIISENMNINGDIESFSGSVEVLGQVVGNCNIKNLTIRETGFLKGNIIGESVKIKGNVEGNIEVKVLKIFSTAKIIGDISYTTLSIEDGADINGNCKRFQTEVSNIEGNITKKKNS